MEHSEIQSNLSMMKQATWGSSGFMQPTLGCWSPSSDVEKVGSQLDSTVESMNNHHEKNVHFRKCRGRSDLPFYIIIKYIKHIKKKNTMKLSLTQQLWRSFASWQQPSVVVAGQDISCNGLIGNLSYNRVYGSDRVPPKSSVLVGFSLINHPFWIPPFMEPPILFMRIKDRRITKGHHLVPRISTQRQHREEF